MHRVDGSVEFTPSWFLRNGGPPFPNPMTADLGYQAELETKRLKILYERFPELNLVDPQAEVIPGFEWPYAELLICRAFGAPPPRWIDENGHWWHDRDFCPWADIQTVEDVARIQVPCWDDAPAIDELLERLDLATQTFPGQTFTTGQWTSIHPTTGQRHLYSYVTSFIDLGPFLMGSVPFFSLLAGNPVVATALMHKGFEVSTGFCDYIHRRCGYPPVEGINPLVGNFGTFMSPRTYERYSLVHDFMVLDYYGSRELPCSLHSCGPSSHLYDYWSQFPHVPVMQTRGISGQTGRLRAAMPNTYLHITLHPPQFEWETAEPERLRAAVWEHAEAAGFHDVDIHIIMTGYGAARGEANVRAFHATLAEVNAHVGQNDFRFSYGYGL